MARRRRKTRLGAASEDHARRAAAASADVVSKTKIVVENTRFGFCTRAYDNLNTATESYGRLRAENRAGAERGTSEATTAIHEARQAFFRRCVMPQNSNQQTLVVRR
jgi:hypothetical protein